MNNFTILTKYILVAVLVVGIFVLWSENQTLKSNLIEARIELEKIQFNNQELQKTIIEKDKILKIKTQNEKLFNNQLNTKNKALNLQNDATLKRRNDENKPKRILLILPEDEKKYSKIIPKIDFKDIELSIQDIDKNKKAQQSKDEFKINPEVFIDKDTKKFDGARLSIEKKF